MVEQINQRGGCFTLEDLSRYQPSTYPVKTTYRGLEVAAFAPPSGGCAVVEMLNILEHSDLAAMGHNTAASIHAIAEAMKLGFADRSVALGDPDFVQVDVERLTSKAHAAERYALSSPETAGEYAPAEGIEPRSTRETPLTCGDGPLWERGLPDPDCTGLVRLRDRGGRLRLCAQQRMSDSAPSRAHSPARD
mgnify:CR=1 FL=1